MVYHVYGWLFLARLHYFIYLVAVIMEFCRSEDTNIIYVGKGESIILLCNVNSNSWPTWDGPGLNGSNFTTYSDRLIIDVNLPNAHKLQILRNTSAGEYNLKISNVSSEEEGLYRCSEYVNGETLPKQTNISLKIKVAPSNITIQNARQGVLQGEENYPLVLKCSVHSGIPTESIMWYKGSVLLGIGGPGNYGLEIVPNRSDHETICTCIVNSSALWLPLNQRITLDIKYKPVVTLDKGPIIRIDEGQNLTMSCLVDSNPAPSGTVIYVNSKGNSCLCNVGTSAHTCTWTCIVNWFDINRNNTGSYVCRSDNDVGYGYKKVEVIVQYPPSISIDKINDENVLRCNPNGNPNTYKFYSWLHLSEFGETIRQFNRSKMITFCPQDPTIRRYQCNGMYICRAENGVRDVSGKLIQSGQILVRQKDQPRFVSGNEKTQYGQFGRLVLLEVSVYSSPVYNKLEVLKNGVCCVNNSAHIHVENTSIEDRIFGKIVHLKGYQIKVHGFEPTGTDFTSYEFRIGNIAGNASYTVTLTATEKPQPPTIEKVVASTTSLNIFWIKSFDGGTRQHFVLMYKKDTDAAWRNESISTENVHVLENLKSDALYMLQIYARNDLGDSNCTELWTIRTFAQEKGTGHVLILTGTILGCIIVITGFVISALWLFKKGFKRKEEHASENGTHENSNQVDLAVENSIYQSYGQNQTQQDEQNSIDQRTVLLSSTENETMYQNSENTFPCNADHMAVENYVYQNQGACGNENVQVNSASRICFRTRNSFATTGNTGISCDSTCSENLKSKGKQKPSTMTNNTDSRIQENQLMNYAEVVFDGRSSSQSIVIRGINDRTIYADIDITAVGTSLPENSQSETVEDDDDDDDFMYIDEIVDYRKSKKM